MDPDRSFDARDIPYADRTEAGAELASLLQRFASRPDVTVLGLPRGGVPVAAEVARALGAPFDVFTVRKIGMPGHREFAIGAIASGGARVLDHELISALQISPRALRAVIFEEEQELARREQLYRGHLPPVAVQGRVAVLVDDGLATGSTMQAAVQAVRALGAARVVVAVPVGSIEACRRLERIADDVICARMPRQFNAVGQWYLDFSDISDDEVRRLLQRPGAPQAATTG